MLQLMLMKQLDASRTHLNGGFEITVGFIVIQNSLAEGHVLENWKKSNK